MPDAAFQLLDRLVEDAKTRHAVLGKPIGTNTLDLIGEILAAHGFGLEIPTHAVGDALFNRASSREPERYIFDCDTGSALYMTIAENVGMKLSLVEITLSSGSGHNYVRWTDPNGRTVDWDVNGRCQCDTPRTGLLPHEGKTMTDTQVMGYFKGIKALIFQRKNAHRDALAAYRESAKLYGESPWAWNNLAWLIATREMPERPQLHEEATRAAERAVAIARTANHLDTLACVRALVGRFDDAITIEREAVKGSADPGFKKRLAMFEAGQNCTGQP